MWLVDLDPTIGHEQAGQRPALVVSVDGYHQRAQSGLVIVLPITSRLRDIPIHVAIAPPEGGLRVASAILCDHIRAISTDRLVDRWGAVTSSTMTLVAACLKALLGV